MTVGILCADGVEQVEVTGPGDALRGAGADVHLVTPDGGPVRGFHYLEPQDRLSGDVSLDDVSAEDLDCVVVPGGLGSPDTLRTNATAVDLTREVAALGRPIGVICHGPWVLIEAGVLAGRSLTCVPALRSDVTNAGASYVDAESHVDRAGGTTLVSGRNFQAVEAFAGALVDCLSKL